MNDVVAAGRRLPAGGLDGVLLLDKPVGLSSNVALQRARRLLGAVKAGHTGSLDPLASGLLPICLGQATRFSGYLLDAAKSYRVRGRLGVRTATGDTEGETVESCEWVHVTRPAMAAAVEKFRGRVAQVPPMYSALKQGGERLYRKARRGETVEREAREVDIRRLELLCWEPPEFELDVRCSKGTYVRTLVEDIARAAGSCAHVTALRRYEAGPFSAEGMVTLAELEVLAEQGGAALRAVILPPDVLLDSLPAVSVGEDEARRLQQGQAAMLAPGESGPVRVYGPAGLLGVGDRDTSGELRARRLMACPING